MQIKWTIKIGDVLMSATVIISIVALLISWNKDRNTRETQLADSVRTTAGIAITNLDRWQALHLSLYRELQPEFIITSEMLSAEFDVVKVRDYLWKTVSNHRVKVSKQVLDEQISTSYVNLLAHFPDTREQFINLFQKLNAIEEKVSGKFLEASQMDVLGYKDKEATYMSAMLGNSLRNTAALHKDRLEKASSEAIAPVKQFLFDVIAKSNSEILNVHRASKNR